MDFEQYSDRELVEKLQNGEDIAYNIIIKRYSSKLLNIINSIIKDGEQSYDVLQETLIKVYKNINNSRGDSSLYTWMTRISINLSFNYVRRNKINILVNQNEDEESEYNILENISYSEHRNGNPEDIVFDQIKNRELYELIESLEPIHKLTLRLKYFDNFSTKEIAEITEVPEGTVRSRLHYARTYLKDRLKI